MISAAWRRQAAIGASAFNHVELSDYEFLVRVGGHIDGPSAGLLMATTFVALQRGKPLKADTTMTGTINPDGSSGPVGGIVQKMRGAAADGIKRFGFPIGAREQVDVGTGQLVDLLALADTLKIEAKELRTLGEAYEFITGETLPSKPLLPDSELELTIAESKALRLVIEKAESDLEKRLDETNPLLAQTTAFDSGAYAKLQREVLQKQEERSQRLLAKGDLVSAYNASAGMCFFLREVAAYSKFWAAWRADEIPELVRQLNSAGAVLSDAELFAREIDAQFPAGFVNDLFALDVHEDTSSAMATGLRNEPLRKKLIQTLNGLKTLPTDESDRTALFRAIRRVLLDAANAQSHLENGRRYASGYAMLKPTGAITNARPVALERNGKSLYASGTASLAYFDAIITSTAGAQAGLTLDEARAAFAQKDPWYDQSVLNRQVLDAKVGTPRLKFVVAYRLSHDAASLANSYYSLGAGRSADGSLTVNATRTMTAQLDLARTAMLESCAAAKQAGWIPPMARFHYLRSMGAREGTDEEKLGALQGFWFGKFWCDLVHNASR